MWQKPAVQLGTEVAPDRGICRRFWPEAEVTGARGNSSNPPLPGLQH